MFFLSNRGCGTTHCLCRVECFFGHTEDVEQPILCVPECATCSVHFILTARMHLLSSPESSTCSHLLFLIWKALTICDSAVHMVLLIKRLQSPSSFVDSILFVLVLGLYVGHHKRNLGLSKPLGLRGLFISSSGGKGGGTEELV